MAQHLCTKEHIWQAIRKRPAFTMVDILSELVKQELKAVKDSTVKDYIGRLVKSGHLAVVDCKRVRNNCVQYRYELMRDVGVEAPSVAKDGTVRRPSLRNEQMWRTMKMLKRFTPQDLAITASTEDVEVKLNTAKAYVGMLKKAGYVAVVIPSKPGTQATYQFLKSRNTGPRPPQVQRFNQVFDPNEGQVVWCGQEDAVCRL